MAKLQVSSIPIRMKLQTSTDLFKKKLIRSMYNELNKKLSSPSFQTALLEGTRSILGKSLYNQPEYSSMVSPTGILRRELGVVNSAFAMNSLMAHWLASAHIIVSKPKLVGDKITGTIITIKAIQADYEDVIRQSYASYKTEDGVDIPWLDWLLQHGQQILVRAHLPKRLLRPTAASRTGTNTIMVKTKGGGWGVPEWASGIPSNNYATRAVADAMPDIINLFEKEVLRSL